MKREITADTSEQERGEAFTVRTVRLSRFDFVKELLDSAQLKYKSIIWFDSKTKLNMGSQWVETWYSSPIFCFKIYRAVSSDDKTMLMVEVESVSKKKEFDYYLIQ